MRGEEGEGLLGIRILLQVTQTLLGNRGIFWAIEGSVKEPGHGTGRDAVGLGSSWNALGRCPGSVPSPVFNSSLLASNLTGNDLQILYLTPFTITETLLYQMTFALSSPILNHPRDEL